MAVPSARIETVRRSCPICEASCGIIVEVDRAAGRITAIRGDADDPRSRGHLCPKVFAPNAVYEDPDRIRRPLRRTTHGFEAISWDEAFDEAASHLQAAFFTRRGLRSI